MTTALPVHFDSHYSRTQLNAILMKRYQEYCEQWLITAPDLIIIYESDNTPPSTWQFNRKLFSTTPAEHTRRWMLNHLIGEHVEAIGTQPEWLRTWINQAIITLWQSITQSIESTDDFLTKPTSEKQKTISLDFSSELGEYRWTIPYNAVIWSEAEHLDFPPPANSIINILAAEKCKLDCMLPSINMPLSEVSQLEVGDIIQFDAQKQTIISLQSGTLVVADCEVSASPNNPLRVLRLS